MKKSLTALLLVGMIGAAAGVAVLSGGVATAATGDVLRTIVTTPGSGCGVGVGIAFDGSELITSCIENQTLTRVNPANGANLGTYTVSGTAGEGFGAISWDANHNVLWAGTYGDKVYKITLNKVSGTGAATLAFSLPFSSLWDGLAYDGTDDSIWVSPDASGPVYHFGLTGTALGTIDVSGKLGGCGNSGIAVVNATTLYLANNGCGQIYSSNKTGTVISLFAQLPGKRVEDLECDNKTFAPKSAIWSKDAYDDELNAFEVPAGQCAQGGVVSDGTVPACALTKTITGPPKAIEVTTSDVGSGLKSIVATKAVNTSVSIPAFAVGSKASVVVTGTKINQSLSSTLELTVKDVAGNTTVCDPVFTTSVGPVTQEVVTGVPEAEHVLTVINDSPGLKVVTAKVNGKEFVIAGLKSGDERSIDIGSALLPGDSNTVKLLGAGPVGSSASVMIWDGA